jgi:hypothetical protein
MVAEVLGAFAGRQDQGLVGDTGGVERPFERRQMGLGDLFVGDHEKPPAAGQGRDVLAGGRQQALAHQNVVAAFAELDPQGFVTAHGTGSPAGRPPAAAMSGCSACACWKASIAARTRLVVTSGGLSSISTATSASA